MSQNNERFLRSLGIFTPGELNKIQETSVAVAGLGLGGSIFVNLSRLGFRKFHVADPDIYERTNINRQRLANENNLGRRKDDCLIDEVRAINPEADIRSFPEGVQLENLNQFLDGVDWVVDVVDLFALPQKIALHREARSRGIPVISCAALGFGGSLIVFDKNTPSFDELTGMTAEAPLLENLQKFCRFIGPEIPDYMKEQTMKALNGSTYFPFVVPGIENTSAFVASELVKNVLEKGSRLRAPQGLFIDPVDLRLQSFEADYRVRTLSRPTLVRKAA